MPTVAQVRSFRHEHRTLLALAFVKLLVHFGVNLYDNLFRDEFYYIACGRHLDFGYVDHPPFMAIVAAVTELLLGDSLFAIRLPAAIAGALLVFMAGMLTRELGGNKSAQNLAGLAALIVPVYLGTHGFLSMNVFDQLFWLAAATILVLNIRNEKPLYWILFGVIVGVGLQNKLSLVFFLFGFLPGVLLTPKRRWLLDKWAWCSGLIATVIFLPHILWQIAYGWPTLEFIHNAATLKNVEMPPQEFLGAQILEVHPFLFPVWVAGFGWYLFSKEGARFRLVGWLCVIITVLLAFQNSKSYYLSPLHSILLAAGAIAVENAIARHRWHWLRPALWIVLILGGLVTMPFTLPALPPDTYAAYSSALGISPPHGERSETGVLPQHLADRYGWEEMVATVASVYDQLTPEERSECVLFAENYGEAGAIDYFGPRYGLPPAVCLHNSYHLWGPGKRAGKVVIAVGLSRGFLSKIFEEVEQSAVHVHEYAMPYESNLPVYVCRRPKYTMQELWESIREIDPGVRYI